MRAQYSHNADIQVGIHGFKAKIAKSDFLNHLQSVKKDNDSTIFANFPTRKNITCHTMAIFDSYSCIVLFNAFLLLLFVQMTHKFFKNMMHTLNDNV